MRPEVTVPCSFFVDRNLTHIEKFVLLYFMAAVVASREGFPVILEPHIIAADTGIDVEDVAQAWSKLKAYGYIQTIPEPNKTTFSIRISYADLPTISSIWPK